jgi:hypothetical protein
MFDKEKYNKILSIPVSIIIASFIIVIVTTGMTDSNAVAALIGGYMGLFLGILFVLIITSMNVPLSNWIDLTPFVTLLIILFLLVFYIYTYYNRIADDHVSSYYTTFSKWSTIFIAIQMIMVLSSLYNVNVDSSKRIISGKTFALLNLIGILNFICVITLGVVLRFYSTQG